MRAFEKLQGIGLHLAFIVPDPAQRPAVSAPCKCVVKAELLLVHPVGQTVDDLVERTVSGDLSDILAIRDVDVVLMDVCNLPPVRRKNRYLFCPVF